VNLNAFSTFVISVWSCRTQPYCPCRQFGGQFALSRLCLVVSSFSFLDFVELRLPLNPDPGLLIEQLGNHPLFVHRGGGYRIIRRLFLLEFLTK